jgi:hypothetical protein
LNSLISGVGWYRLYQGRGHDGMVLVYQDGFGGGRADVEA